MENNKKNIDDLFRDELGSYTETPPPAAWSALDKKLSATRVGGHFTGRKVWYFGLLSLALLLSIPAIKNIPGIFNSGNNNLVVKENAGSNTQHTTGATTGNNAINTKPGNDNQSSSPTTIANDKTKNEQQTIAQKTGNKKSTSTNIKHTHSKNLVAATSNINNENNNKETNQQPLNIFNHSISNPAPIDESTTETSSNNKGTPPEKQSKDVTANKTKTNTTIIKTIVTKHQPKPWFDRFELGIKGGYERGFENDASARKIVVSPYLQYNISPKFSIMLQPSIKGAQIDNRNIGTPHSYYQVNADGHIASHTDSNINVIGVPTKFYAIIDTYIQSHDSIVKTYSIGSTYMEFEVPVLLKFNVTSRFSVYGGVNFVYSQMISIKESTYTSAPITQKVVPENPVMLPYGTPAPDPPPFTNQITYTGTSISSYMGPVYSNSMESTWRAGYMLGFSYEYSKRWLFDALIQQANFKTNMQGGYNVNAALSLPYFRLTLGYKLLK